jgi:Fibronectin type III domain
MGAPPQLFLSGSGDTSLTFTWTFGDTPDSFELTRNSPDYKVLIPDTTNLSVNAYTDTGLAPSTDYEYTVIAHYGTTSQPGSATFMTAGATGGSGSSGKPPNVTTGQPVYPAKPVTDFQATALTYDSVELRWRNPGDGSQLQIFRFPSGGGASYMVYWANDPANSCVDQPTATGNPPPPDPGVTYFYQAWTGFENDVSFTKVSSNTVTLPAFSLRAYLQSQGFNLSNGFNMASITPAVTSIRAYAKI